MMGCAIIGSVKRQCKKGRSTKAGFGELPKAYKTNTNRLHLQLEIIMTTSVDFIISFPVDSDMNFVVDPNGDTMLTFSDVYIEGVSAGAFSFQVSSAALQRESAFFENHFKDFWAPPVQAGKYHLLCGFNGAELVGLLVLLLTMHQNFATRTSNNCLLPRTVSMSTLSSIIRMTDFFLVRSAGELLQHPTVRWLDAFKRDDGRWALPKSMKGRLMLWYCLSRDLGEYGLNEAVNHSIVRYSRPGTLDNNFGWPVRMEELEDLDQERGWRGF